MRLIHTKTNMKRKKHKSNIKWVCILLAAILFISPMQVSATQSRSSNFNYSFSLGGSQADNLIAVARAQLGKTKAQLGYTEAWCADFVSDCAKLAGLGHLIPFDGYCLTLYNKIKNAGGQDVSTPQKGDLVFYYCKSCKTHWCHVGIMVDSVNSIEGNYGGKVSNVAGRYSHNNHSLANGIVTRRFVRPAYSAPSISVDAPQIQTWISDSKMGEVPADFKYGKRYYLCYKIVDLKSGRLFNEVAAGVNYTITETIYNPDGSIAGRYDYERSDNNWMSVVANSSGTYRGVIEMKGDFEGNSTVSFEIPPFRPGMNIWFSDTKMGAEKTNGTKGDMYYLCYEIIDMNTNRRMSEVAEIDYEIVETIFKPNGQQENSCTYYNSDNNWIACTADSEGTYKGVIKVNGVQEVTAEIKITEPQPVRENMYYGDLDGDGKVTVNDLAVISQAINGKIKLKADEKKRADLNGDGRVTKADKELINQFILKTITEFPVENQLASITITKEPVKTAYTVGEKLDTGGMVVTAQYNNGKSKEVTGYKVNGNASIAGRRKIEIRYTEAGILKKASFYIQVNKRPVTKRLTYIANGGTGAPKAQSAEANSKVTVSTVLPEKNYRVSFLLNGGSMSVRNIQVKAKFAGWNTDRKGTGTMYAPGSSLILSKNMTLYACYDAGVAGELPTPVRNGYRFSGWYYKGEKVTANTKIDGNCQLKAQWEVNTAPPQIQPEEQTGVYYGDLDGDGQVSISDLSAVNQAVNGNVTFTEDERKRADVDGDGRITQQDVQLIQDYILEEISEFPVGKQL